MSTVSVIIPVFNSEKYLDKCIESVVNQSYSNLEIILVDDGSTDGSSDVCSLWAEKDCRIKVIHKANEGAGLARNTGLDSAAGDYIFFVDSDDCINPNTVEKCVSVAKRDNSQLVLYARADVDKNGKIVNMPVLTDKLVYKDSEVTEELLSSLYTHSKGFGLGVCGKMFETKTVRQADVRFYSEREVLSEDALFLTDFFAFVNSASIVPEYYYLCVQREDSLSKKINVKYRQHNDEFLKTALKICEKNGYSENTVNHLKARYLIYALGGIRRIYASDLTDRQKKNILKDWAADKLLCETLSEEVLNLGTNNSKFFWKLFKSKCFILCNLLLKIKAGN